MTNNWILRIKRKRHLCFIPVLVMTVIGLDGVIPARAASVRSLSLPEIVEKSGQIVHGVVTEVKSGEDPQTSLICTWTTVRIHDVLKGAGRSKEMTFKQLGGYDKASGVTWEGARVVLKPGAEILLCLFPKSRWGFSAPVGRSQGVFHVYSNHKTGEKYVDNGMPKEFLFSNPRRAVSSHAAVKKQSAGQNKKTWPEQNRSLKLTDIKQTITKLSRTQNNRNQLWASTKKRHHDVIPKLAAP